MKWHSSIKPALMRKKLINGTFLGTLGLICIFLATNFVLFFIGLFLIIKGMVPYKKLWSLEGVPDKLSIEKKEFIFYCKGCPTLAIPFESIKELLYVETSTCYGIGILLENPASKKVRILNTKFSLKHFLKRSQKMKTDIFFPYFSQSATQEIKNEWILSNKIRCLPE